MAHELDQRNPREVAPASGLVFHVTVTSRSPATQRRAGPLAASAIAESERGFDSGPVATAAAPHLGHSFERTEAAAGFEIPAGPVLQLYNLRPSTVAKTEASEEAAKQRGENGGFRRRAADSEHEDENGYISVADKDGYVDFGNDSYWKPSSQGGKGRPDPGLLERVNLGTWGGGWVPGSKGTRYRHKTAANILATNYMDGEGHTWHHTMNDGELELLSTSVHQAHYHNGGFSNWGSKY